MKIPVSFGGGGGSGSDDCTATAADVLKSKTAIYSGTDDEPENGSMEDYSGTTKTATPALDSSSSQMTFAIPNTGKYDTAAKLAATYATIRSLIGYTDASKVLAGTSFLGLAGTMTNRSGTTQTATASLSDNYVRMQIPATGYYDTTSYVRASYSSVASLIGLTAAKIKYGETILGVTGTWEGYVAKTSDLFYNGAVGTVGGSMNTYSSSYITVAASGSVIRVTVASGSSDVNCGGVSFGTAINMSGYSTLTLTINIISAYSSSGSATVRYYGIGLFTSRPTSASACDLDNAAYSARGVDYNSTGTKTLTLDVSSINSSYYVAFCARNNVTNVSWTGEITRIQLS